MQYRTAWRCTNVLETNILGLRQSKTPIYNCAQIKIFDCRSRPPLISDFYGWCQIDSPALTLRLLLGSRRREPTGIKTDVRIYLSSVAKKRNQAARIWLNGSRQCDIFNGERLHYKPSGAEAVISRIAMSVVTKLITPRRTRLKHVRICTSRLQGQVRRSVATLNLEPGQGASNFTRGGIGNGHAAKICIKAVARSAARGWVDH